MTTLGATKNEYSGMINDKSCEKRRAMDSGHSQNLEIARVKKPKQHDKNICGK